MANEITEAAFTSNGGLVSEVLSDMLVELVYDKSALADVVERIPWDVVGSKTKAIPQAPVGDAMAAASSETSSGFSNTAFTTSEVTLSIARQGLVYQPTDLWQLAGPNPNLDFVAGRLAGALVLRLTDQIAGLFASVSSSVGTTTVDMSVDDFYDAIFALNLANNAGPLTAVLHGQQVNDLLTSIRSEAGPGEHRADAQDALGALPGWGFKFRFLNVDVYQSDSVATANAGADRDGCMFSQGAFGYTVADPRMVDPLLNPGDVFLMTPELWIERARDQINGMTQLISNAYTGVVELDDSRAVRIITDA